MSKLLVALCNNGAQTIKFYNSEDTGNDQTLQPSQMFVTDTHFNIPDNSDSGKYFQDHHMEIQDENGNALFSFWDDDDSNYLVYYCVGTNWQSATQLMSGSNEGGDNLNVGIVYSSQGLQLLSALTGV